MKSEIDALVENKTWKLVKRTATMKVIGCKWVYKKKFNPDGTLNKLKARIVALGYNQTEGIDYKETFAPVLHQNSFRTLMAIAVELGLDLDVSDVSNAFTHAPLEETIYMEQPPGFSNGDDSYVCELLTSLYGLKQAPRQWNKDIHSKITMKGFQNLQSDPCIYFKRDKDLIHLIGVYVDDLIQLHNWKESFESMKAHLDKHNKIVHLGSPTLLLGMRINHINKSTITIDLETYTKAAINKYCQGEIYPVHTPQELGLKTLLASPSDTIIKPDDYKMAIGSLMYICSRTRPDISTAVRQASEHLKSPTINSWNLVNRIFRYLFATITHSLTFTKSSDMQLTGYADADWGSCINTRRSVTGALVFIGGNLIMWKSTKQNTTALSATESEYMSVTDACREVLWIRQLLEELSIFQKDATTIYEDNNGCIKLANNPLILSRSKHIDIRHHFIRQTITNGKVKLLAIPSAENRSDIMTKAIPRPLFERHVEKLGLRSAETVKYKNNSSINLLISETDSETDSATKSFRR